MNFIKQTLIMITIIFIVLLYCKLIKFNDNKTKINYKKNYFIIFSIVIFMCMVLSTIYLIIIKNYFSEVYKNNKIVFMLFAQLLILLPMLIHIFYNGEKINTIGITSENFLKSLILGVLLIGVYYLMKLKLYGNKEINITIYNLMYFLIVGIGEEILWRGYAQNRLIYKFGKLRGLLLTALIFSVIHIPQRIIVLGLDLKGVIMSIFFIMPISITLGYIAYKTKDIITSSILHTIANLI